MFILPRERRSVLDLSLAFGIGILLLALSITVNFSANIHQYFAPRLTFPVVILLVNGLCLWLAVMLAVAFARWSRMSRDRAELENIISSISPETLIVIDPERLILICSRSVSNMFGFSPEDVVGKKTDALYFDRRSSAQKRPHEIREALERNGFHVGLATGQRKNGTVFPLEIITGQLGRNRGAVLLLKDISDRVREEEVRREMEVRILQKQKLESLGVLAGTLAHDFNNLLTGILGHADLAIHEIPGDSPVRENVNAIVEAGKHAAELWGQEHKALDKVGPG